MGVHASLGEQIFRRASAVLTHTTLKYYIQTRETKGFVQFEMLFSLHLNTYVIGLTKDVIDIFIGGF